MKPPTLYSIVLIMIAISTCPTIKDRAAPVWKTWGGGESFWKCIGRGVNTLFKCVCRVVYNKSKCGSRGERWYGYYKKLQKLPKLLKKWHSWTCRKYTVGKNQTSNSSRLAIGPFGAGQLRFNQSCSFFQNISLHACTSSAILQVSTQNLNDVHAF